MPTDKTNSISFRVKNASGSILTIILEPWANEYTVQPGDELEVVERGGDPVEQIGVQAEDAKLIFFARTGSIMSAWRDGRELP